MFLRLWTRTPRRTMLSCSVSFPGTTINRTLYQLLRYKGPMLHGGFLALVLLTAQTGAFTLQGQITTDQAKSSIRLVLEDPKARNAEVGRAEAGAEGNYEFRDL